MESTFASRGIDKQIWPDDNLSRNVIFYHCDIVHGSRNTHVCDAAAQKIKFLTTVSVLSNTDAGCRMIQVSQMYNNFR